MTSLNKKGFSQILINDILREMNQLQLSKYSVIFLIIVAAVAGGGVPAFSKIALQQVPPFIFIFLRFLLAAVILVPIFLSKKEIIEKKKLKDAILISLLATSNVTFFALGVRKTTATIAQMLYAAVPIIASIFSYLFLKEKIKLEKVVGILLGFIGVLIIILLPAIGKPSAFKGNLIGNLLIFIAVASYSLYTVMSKKNSTNIFSSISYHNFYNCHSFCPISLSTSRIKI